METLQEFKQRAISAHNWTSFDPDKRGEQLIEEFTDILNNDLKEIETASDEQKINYINKFKSLFSSWISAKSNCASSFVAGPSNFPVRKAQRANEREQKHYEAFTYWRGKAKKAIIKSLEPEKTLSSEIERYKIELEGRLKNQDIMKLCNAIIRKAKGNDCTAQLVEVGLTVHQAQQMQIPDFCGRIGFAQFNLTNNLANIKRVEERIKDLENKAAKQAEGKNKEFSFDGGKVIFNYELDRLQILHDTKPNNETIGKLKHAGFKWAPSQAAWQRQLTNNAIYSLKYFSGIQINGGL